MAGQLLVDCKKGRAFAVDINFARPVCCHLKSLEPSKISRDAELVKTWTVWESVAYGLGSLTLAAFFGALMLNKRKVEKEVNHA